MSHHPAPRRALATLTLGLALTASSALAVAATTPELPPNAAGHVAICLDGEQTSIIPEASMDEAMATATVRVGTPTATKSRLERDFVFLRSCGRDPRRLA